MKYIDLFAGCGGLSLGLSAAGFKLAFAVENSPMAGETYYHNLVKSIRNGTEWESYLDLNYAESDDMLKALKSGLVVSGVEVFLQHWHTDKKFKEKVSNLYQIESGSSAIDLVSGGPPCQGFSMAGRRVESDQRNTLPDRFLEYVSIFNPSAVLLENVVGMRKRFSLNSVSSGKAVFHQLAQSLRDTGFHGYQVQELQLNAAHYAVPQNRPRLFLIGIRNDIAEKNSVYPSDHLWNSSTENLTPYCPEPSEERFSVADAFSGLGVQTRSQRAARYQKNLEGLIRPLKSNNLKVLKNHNKRKHSEIVKNRFSLYQYFKEKGISQSIFLWSDNVAKGIEEDKYEWLISEEIKKADFKKRLKSGVYWNSKGGLRDWLTILASRKHSQRTLDKKAPAPTVLSIPDDVIHPTEHRTLTVREQARLQSFPDSFEFRSRETTGGSMRKIQVPQYTQVGNAVPPLLAQSIGRKIQELVKGGC